MTAPRILPHSIELEQALLGAVLMNNDAYNAVANFLEPGHFYEPTHQKFFDVAAKLIREGRPATPVTMSQFLPADIDVGGLTASQYLARLAAEATTVINARDYGRSIRDLAERREIIAISEATIAAAMVASPEQDAQAIGNSAVEALAEIIAADGAAEASIRAIGATIVDYVEHVAAVYQGTANEDVICTGLKDLDTLTGGMPRGGLVILAGRPGMGKTTVAGAFALNAAHKGHGVAFFTLEMPMKQIMPRLLADILFGGERLSVHTIAKAKFKPEQFDSIADAARAMERLPLWIDDNPHATVGGIHAKCQTAKKRLERAGKRLDLVVIDYLKFVHASDRYRGQRHYEVGEVTAALKQFARKLGVVVVLCAQLNRQVELRQDKRPQLSDLRESGDIEADADLVLLLFREAYYLRLDPELQTDMDKMRRLEQVQHLVDIIVAKNRHGPTDSVQAFVSLEHSAVRDLARPDLQPAGW